MNKLLPKRPTFVSVTPYRTTVRKAMVWFGDLDDSIPADSADAKTNVRLLAPSPAAPNLKSVSKSLPTAA